MHRLRHFVLEEIVRGHIAARRRADEDEGEPFAQLGRLGPQRVERADALGNSLRVVDAIDADAELPRTFRVALAQRVDARRALSGATAIASNRSTSMLIGKAPTRIDAIAERDGLTGAIDLRVRHVFVDAVEEVHRVAIDLEFHQVVAEQSTQNRFVRAGGQAVAECPAAERECARTDE